MAGGTYNEAGVKHSGQNSQPARAWACGDGVPCAAVPESSDIAVQGEAGAWRGREAERQTE